MKQTAARCRGLSSFTLHILAMALMLCDHAGRQLFPAALWMTSLGRLAFPIFAFLLAEGFFHTSNRKKYALRLFIFALISEIPFNLLAGGRLLYPRHQNVLFTFFLSVLTMALLDRIRRKTPPAAGFILSLPVCAAACWLGQLTCVDYFGAGPLTVLLFFFTRTETGAPRGKKAAAAVLQLLGLLWLNGKLLWGPPVSLQFAGISAVISQQLLALPALPLIRLYRGEQGPYGKTVRRLYYWFYPAHLVLLAAISALC